MPLLNKTSLQILMACSLFSLNNQAIAETHHEYGHEHDSEHNHTHEQYAEQSAHEHGVALMQFVIDEHHVLIEVSSPLYNVIGFETEPSTPEQVAVFQKQLTAIDKGELLRFNPQAQCQLKNKTVDNPFPKMKAHDHAVHEHEHQHDGHEHHMEHAHTNLSFEYQLHCQNPEQLTQLDTQPLFKAWSNLQTLRVEWIYQNQQSAKTLDRNQPVLLF